MMTYIWKDAQGYFVECEEPIDAEYWEGQIGSTIEDFWDGKWVLLSEEQAQFHQENPDATINQVWDMSTAQIEVERTLQIAKSEMIETIDRYDSGSQVNCFYVVKTINTENGDQKITIPAWLTPAERSNYRSSIDAAELLGVETLQLYIGNELITLSTQQAKTILAQIQLYADQCYIVTRQHKAAVEAFETIESVDSYDYTMNYPQKLSFELD